MGCATSQEDYQPVNRNRGSTRLHGAASRRRSSSRNARRARSHQPSHQASDATAFDGVGDMPAPAVEVAGNPQDKSRGTVASEPSSGSNRGGDDDAANSSSENSPNPLGGPDEASQADIPSTPVASTPLLSLSNSSFGDASSRHTTVTVRRSSGCHRRNPRLNPDGTMKARF